MFHYPKLFKCAIALTKRGHELRITTNTLKKQYTCSFLLCKNKMLTDIICEIIKFDAPEEEVNAFITRCNTLADKADIIKNIPFTIFKQEFDAWLNVCDTSTYTLPDNVICKHYTNCQDCVTPKLCGFRNLFEASVIYDVTITRTCVTSILAYLRNILNEYLTEANTRVNIGIEL